MYKGRMLPSKLVFVKKFGTSFQPKGRDQSDSWKARSYLVICRSFSKSPKEPCHSSPDIHGDIDLLRM
eukprot:12537162-Prorocentrum_lima.AAC.1